MVTNFFYCRRENDSLKKIQVFSCHNGPIDKL